MEAAAEDLHARKNIFDCSQAAVHLPVANGKQ